MKNFRTTLLAMLCCVTSAHAASQIHVFKPTRDATIFEDEPAVASGAGDRLFAGVTANGLARRALLFFDLSGIPAGSQVVSAELALVADRAVGADNPMSLHRLLADWGEGLSNGGAVGSGAGAGAGDVTWTFRFFADETRKWASEGGDFEPVPSATAVVGTIGTYRWTSTDSPGLLADVQSWIDAPESNLGWLLIGDEGSPDRSAKRFFSREYLVPSDRPYLRVEVVPVPEPSALAMLGIGAGLVGVWGRRRRGS